ncbi:ABC transporter ATP-binding protein [Paenibacillus sp. FSL H8-0548]|uniref:ABC transporter transmembrane domain-containing protein n=1 Tax=Paenibacillus sp. FSL H8-0548 TaxID=1920422 RepID=UPI00096C307F|nr:ABC transporter transmembrane domain-containing protein [Paenibacillus sp. FSL H8-0548]OMF23857.1 ABC transporter ATP-binding protein [Paenibacillus sp. FSL H8-0548]
MAFTVIRQLIGYMRAYKPLAALFFVTLFLDLLFISLAPLSFQVLIDKAITPKDMNAFTLILFIIGISGVICVSAGVLSDYALSKLIARIQKDLRMKLFQHMQQVNMGFFQKTRSSELLSHFTVDLPAIEYAMSALLTVGIQSAAVVTISTIVLFYLQWKMALVILLGAAFVFIGPYLLSRRAQAINSSHKEQLDLMTGDVQETLKAQKVIKGFNLQQAMTEKFADRLQTMFHIHYRKNIMAAQLERLPMVSLLVVNMTIIAIGSYLALHEYITLGALVAFFTMYTSMGNSVFNLTFTIPAFTDASVSIERMNRLLNAPKEATGSLPLARAKNQLPDLRFSDVSFSYNEERETLKKINLHIAAGTTAAFVGSSGSGKSTLIQLVLGFYEPSAGQLEINGQPMQDISRGSIRDQLGVVFQENFLFRGTIIENIRISKPEATKKEIIKAAEQAEIHSYIMSLPDGYDTLVMDDGSNFSGGQRQRLAIARAILRNPPMLLLDEATSALDPISEASINETFNELAPNRTVITVTHRLASIVEADCIFVFDKGELVDSGTHQHMLSTDGYYKQLWDKQHGISVSENGQEADIDEERLAKLPFFEGVDRSILQEIRSLFNTETFAPGQSIIQEGEQGEKFYFIARGRVEVSRRDANTDTGVHRLAVLGDGDYFGEIALMNNVPRTADVTAITACTFLTLQRKGLHYVLSKHPELDERVRQTLKDRK